MSEERTLCVFGRVGQTYLPLIESRLPEWRVVGWTNEDDLTRRDEEIARCEAAVLSPDFILTPGNLSALLQAPHLKIMIQPWVGTDWAQADLLPEGLKLCNATGHGAPMAEFVLAALLSHVTQIHSLDNGLRRGDWSRGGRNPDPKAMHGDMRGKTLGIIGYGEIGQAVAHRAAAFGVNICAVARSERAEVPSPLNWIGTSKDLHRLCRESDFIVVTCDLNDDTRGMIDAAAFAAMPEHCYLVNVARGEVIEETALYEALRDKTIGGATIDTWYRYPENVLEPGPDPDRGGVFCGSQHDFYALENVTVTPHSAAHTAGSDLGRYESIAQTLRDYTDGLALTRHVMTGTARKSS